MANILVRDDEESIRFSFHRFLTTAGHHVATAGWYTHALAKMDELEFDLILADIILGDGCGKTKRPLCLELETCGLSFFG
jgi:two-component system, NtrC family, response regulator HydG